MVLHRLAKLAAARLCEFESRSLCVGPIGSSDVEREKAVEHPPF